MHPQTNVKICGLSQQAHVNAAVGAGAAYVGFVFFPKSPRNVTVESAKSLAESVPPGIQRVALFVNPADEEIRRVLDEVPIDMIQLHGAESPERVSRVESRFGLPAMKAVGVKRECDLRRLDDYSAVASQLLVDAKPSEDSKLPGGNGLAFDWRLIAGRNWRIPWMLAGGLDDSNVATAIRLTGARQVDVSSGVESSPGRKSPDKILAFVTAAQGG
ncbi:MAG: phosphoribosylanthranilate isomerase [Albidovulum sp.]|nr:phosphoribosylanthranilate isomerase [Albidovulum sp.]MDE0304443.1 phosphoribosylanthranilate isomerase [Albidovulum sp.]MDE0533227.1 phosphoribosylanthranilate isomerase [Albidovulum sp.]